MKSWADFQRTFFNFSSRFSSETALFILSIGSLAAAARHYGWHCWVRVSQSTSAAFSQQLYMNMRLCRIAHHIQWHAPAQGWHEQKLCILPWTLAQENQAATRVTCSAKVDPGWTSGYPKGISLCPNAGYEPKGSLVLTQWPYAVDEMELLLGSMWWCNQGPRNQCRCLVVELHKGLLRWWLWLKRQPEPDLLNLKMDRLALRCTSYQYQLERCATAGEPAASCGVPTGSSLLRDVHMRSWAATVAGGVLQHGVLPCCQWLPAETTRMWRTWLLTFWVRSTRVASRSFQWHCIIKSFATVYFMYGEVAFTGWTSSHISWTNRPRCGCAE